MKRLIISLIALTFGAAIVADGAQAARLGGGRSLGVQRQVAVPPKQVTPPSQQPATAPQSSGSGRWFAPLAGLAAGLGLGWLFAQGGFGSAFGVFLVALLAGVLVLAFMRSLSRERTQGSRTHYAGFGDETVAAPPPSQLLGDTGAQPDYRSQFVSSIPSDFDVEGFLKEARRNFLRIQDANDRGDLARLRQVTTEEMFDALKSDALKGSGEQGTDVVSLKASLLELVTERDLHWASVRFSGSIREKASAPAEPFEEIWNLCKPANGASGWLLAGIQQPN
jgi:predicted lipid-binding transport protein (Tim44 family)